MSSARPVPMTDGSPPRRRLRLPGRPAVRLAACCIAVGVVGLVTLRAPGSASVVSRSATTAATTSTVPTPARPAVGFPSTGDPSASSRSAEAPPTSGPTVDPGEPPPTTIGAGTSVTLPPRPPDVRLDPEALAARFVAEWLTYPPGVEPASVLAARLSELVTRRYRTVVEGLSTAGTEDRSGSRAVMGATTRITPEDAGPTAPVVYRVTAWQARYQPSGPPVGPDSWDVTLVRDPGGGWLVDGLRRAG